ncbi:hypothetical protein T4B_10499 [Trichinella pseudospiralis]|uniref:C-type lectin domain-containing protein n=1 Tax=Trichinella pseudospiralis TaxID=6337 RepID=A0A0V1IXX8_TRIPS|nr:hypothetical protein T4B_10499 [Trichinella pseudospiralis]
MNTFQIKQLIVLMVLGLFVHSSALHCPHDIFTKTAGWTKSNVCMTVVKAPTGGNLDEDYVKECQKYDKGEGYMQRNLASIIKKQKLVKERASNMTIYLNYKIVGQVFNQNRTTVKYTLSGTLVDAQPQVFEYKNSSWNTRSSKIYIPTEWVKKIGNKTIETPLCAVFMHNKIEFVQCKSGQTFTRIICKIEKLGKCKTEHKEFDENGCNDCDGDYMLPYCTDNGESIVHKQAASMSSSSACCQQLLRTTVCHQLRLVLMMLLLIKYGQAPCPHKIFKKTPGWELADGCATVVKIHLHNKYDNFEANYLETCQQYNSGSEYSLKNLGKVLPKKKIIKERSDEMKIYLNYNITNQKYFTNMSVVDYTVFGTLEDGQPQTFFRKNNLWTSTKEKIIPSEWVNKIGYEKIEPPLCAVYMNNHIDFIPCKFGVTFTHVVCNIPQIGKCITEDEEMKPEGCTACKEDLLLPFCFEKVSIYESVINPVSYVTPIDYYLNKKRAALSELMDSTASTTMTSVVSFTPGNKNEESEAKILDSTLIAMNWHFKKEINLKSFLSLKKPSNLFLLFFTICLLSLLDNCSSKNGHCPHEIFVNTPGWNTGNSCLAIVKFTSNYDDIERGYINSCKQYNHGTVYNTSDLYDMLHKNQQIINSKAKSMKIYLNFQIVNQMMNNNSTAVNYTIHGTAFKKKVEMFQLRNNTWTTMDELLNNSIPIYWVKQQENQKITDKLCAVYQNKLNFVNCKMNPFTHVVCIIPQIGECKIVNAEMDVKGCTYCEEGYLLPYCLKEKATENAEQMYLTVGIASVSVVFLLIIILIYIRMKGELSLILEKNPSTPPPAPQIVTVPESSQSILSFNESERDTKDIIDNNKFDQKYDDKIEGRTSDYMSTLKQFASIKLGINYQK